MKVCCRGLLATIAMLSACGPRLAGFDSGGQDETTTAMTSMSSGPTTDATTTDATTIEPSDTSTTDASTDMTFVPMTEYPTGDPCDLWAQDCPDGEKCVPYVSTGSGWDALKCVPITGSQAPGEPCISGGFVEATDNCDATSICWDMMEVDGELLGTCIAQCTGTPDVPMCPEGSECVLTSNSVIAVCLHRCDPLLQDCNEGLGCYWEGTSFSCSPTSSDIPVGEPCGFINDCAAGLLCAAAEFLPMCADASCCTNFCDLDLGDAQCDVVPGTLCVPFYEQAPPGGENLGVCVLQP